MDLWIIHYFLFACFPIDTCSTRSQGKKKKKKKRLSNQKFYFCKWDESNRCYLLWLWCLPGRSLICQQTTPAAKCRYWWSLLSKVCGNPRLSRGDTQQCSDPRSSWSRWICWWTCCSSLWKLQFCTEHPQKARNSSSRRRSGRAWW